MYRLRDLSGRAVEACWLAAVAFLPLTFSAPAYNLELSKAALFRSLVALMVAAWIVSLWEEGARAPERGGAGAGLRAPLRRPGLLLALGYALLYLLSTLLSVSPWHSFWGEPVRQQGFFNVAAYVALFLVVATRLRQRAQLLRLVQVILLASVPMVLYGFFQAAGLDPVRQVGNAPDLAYPVFATAGQHVFFGSYLVLVAPLTLARLLGAVGEWRRAEPTPEGRRSSVGAVAQSVVWALGPGAFFMLFLKAAGGTRNSNIWWIGPAVFAVVAAAATLRQPARAGSPRWLAMTGYGTLLAGQLLALLFSQARGAWLAMLAAFLVFILLLILRRPRRGIVIPFASMVIVVAGFLIALNLPGTPLQPLKNVPYVERMGHLLETRGGSGRVRLLIWQGVADVVSERPRLGVEASGTSPLRHLVGYGPETLVYAFNRVFPPALWRMGALDQQWDRSHDDPLDALAMTGVLGLLAYLAVVLYHLVLGWRRFWRAPDDGARLTLAALTAAVVGLLADSVLGIPLNIARGYLWLYLGVISAGIWLLPMGAMPEAPLGEAAGADAQMTGGGRASPAGPSPRPRRGRMAAAQRTREERRGRPGQRFALLGLAAYLGVTLLLMLALASARQINAFGALAFLAALLLLGGLAVVTLALPRGGDEGPGRGRRRWVYVPLLAATGFVLFLNFRVWTGSAYFSYGTAAVGAGRPDIGVRELRRAVAATPGEDQYYAGLGQAFEAMVGQASAGQALPYAPTAREALTLPVADLRRLQKDDVRALAAGAYLGATERAPLDARHYLALARLYRQWGQDGAPAQLAHAEEYYRQAAALSPNDPQLWAEWADVALSQGHVALAEQRAAEALARAPNFWFANYQMAHVQAQQGKLTEALQRARQALKAVRNMEDYALAVGYIAVIEQRINGGPQ